MGNASQRLVGEVDAGVLAQDPAGLPVDDELADDQGLTLIHFAAQPKLFWSHLPVSPSLVDWGEIMHPTYSHNLCLS